MIVNIKINGTVCYLETLLSKSMIKKIFSNGILFSDGWFTSLHGYQYKNTSSNGKTWEESRRICQNWGGDLMVHGVRDPAIRK